MGGGDEDWLAWAATSPGSTALHIVPTRLDLDGVRLYVDESATPLNPNGAVHGGIVAAICDQAISLAIMRRMPGGRAIVTGTLNLEYLRPALPRLEVTAWVDRVARSLVFARAEIRSAGALTTLATGTFVPVEIPLWAPDDVDRGVGG
ncbi:PaaI family thioesterase [Pseudonocardia xishanensis]|uniref:PaaI family thioesterase n=1 Tax=Pseudonocardia xishanensis TaxID=630995 RepID=UPI0031EAE2E6